MSDLVLADVQVLVLTPDETNGTTSHSKGKLFETFVARLLQSYGYEKPTPQNLNVTSEGIELDITARSRLTGKRAIAECKAYSRPVKAKELTNFFGKLSVERFEEADAFGIMAVVPRLTPEGEEKARSIAKNDSNFLYLNAQDIADRLIEEGLISAPPIDISYSSDPVVVITPDGVFAARIRVDQKNRVPIDVLSWSASGEVPTSTLELIASDSYAQNLTVRDARSGLNSCAENKTEALDSPILVSVKGSQGDFEYQLPASPRYFVGRRDPVGFLQDSLKSAPGSVVLNAQSGWGKSSLALKFADIATQSGGYALVLDSRTANDARFVVESIRKAVTEATSEGLIELPSEASWASLSSCLTTLSAARWLSKERYFLIFFDQFENVFKSESLTRTFRDLSAGVRSIQIPLVVGFAWKTDLVGWTEGHPFQLRDEIRSNSGVLVVEPFGSNEVSTLLSRLEKEISQKLSPDLRSRLREYSQGLPWLLKKLSDHVLREIRSGSTQERLIAEALNVQSLFEADLSQLSPSEHETIRHTARYAPVPASEVTERFGPDAIQSLVDRRLLVQIGEKLDTYWDTFRDYLNTGRVPVEDSYILRQAPSGVGRLIPPAIQAGGSIGVKELCEQLQTSANVIFNLSRELRLLGITTYDPSRVTIIDEVVSSRARETMLRRRVAQALRRHKAYSTFSGIADRAGGHVTAQAFADVLPSAFPAVEAKFKTWDRYSRVYLAWFTYAGLAEERNGRWTPRPDGEGAATLRLLAERPVLRAKPALPQTGPRKALELLGRLGKGEQISLSTPGTPDREVVRMLFALGAVRVNAEHKVELSSSELVDQAGNVRPHILASLLEEAPGGREGLEFLRSFPAGASVDVGQVIQSATGASWTPATVQSVGSALRSWAEHAGLRIVQPKRASPTKSQEMTSRHPDRL